ncbi:KIAA1430-like protein-domain-containing protein [Globomyces pollinis-pini]|nr:KIAA1430-like protein-domain-containing protein [Globomyces pollinis-pini]
METEANENLQVVSDEQVEVTVDSDAPNLHSQEQIVDSKSSDPELVPEIEKQDSQQLEMESNQNDDTVSAPVEIVDTQPATVEIVASDEQIQISNSVQEIVPEKVVEPVVIPTQKSSVVVTPSQPLAVPQPPKQRTSFVRQSTRACDLLKLYTLAQLDPLNKVKPPTTNDYNIQLPKQPIPDPYPYRHYRPFHPCSNRLLAMKWDQTNRDQHLKALAMARSTVDNGTPKPYLHLQYKLKKHQIEYDRQCEIHRNNKILLDRMSHIMYMEAKDPKIHITDNPDNIIVSNSGFRARRAAQIQLENKKMLQRLESKQPNYNHYHQMHQRYNNLAYLESISMYPERYTMERREYKNKVGDSFAKKKIITNYSDKVRTKFLSNDTRKVKKSTRAEKVLPDIRPKTSTMDQETLLKGLESISDGMAAIQV